MPQGNRPRVRTRYRFSHRAGGFYYWQAVLPTDSRYEQIRCSVDWFWANDEMRHRSAPVVTYRTGGTVTTYG
jgi:hypothetical protein